MIGRNFLGYVDRRNNTCFDKKKSVWPHIKVVCIASSFIVFWLELQLSRSLHAIFIRCGDHKTRDPTSQNQNFKVYFDVPVSGRRNPVVLCFNFEGFCTTSRCCEEDVSWVHMVQYMGARKPLKNSCSFVASILLLLIGGSFGALTWNHLES